MKLALAPPTRAVSYVVGDEFGAFADGSRILTCAQAMSRLGAGPVDWDEVDFAQGLGLAPLDCDALRQALSEAGAPRDVVDRFRHEVAALDTTHKREARHVLIGPPRQVDERSFQFGLVVDGGVHDRLCDHVTGCHVAGMLLVEAARQAVTVTLERLYNPDGVRVGALDSMKVTFQSFVFPLPVVLHVRCLEETQGGGPRIPMTIAVAALQLGQAVADMEFHVTIASKRLLRRVEEMAAHRIVAQATARTPLTDATCAAE
jgi:hypothetical protein